MSAHKPILLLFTALVVLFSSCEPSQEELLCKKWKTVQIYNTILEKNIIQYKQLLDTVTANNELVEYAGGLAAFKQMIQADIHDLTEKQQVKDLNQDNSFLEIKPDKKIYFISVNGIDSAKWFLEEDDLVADDEAFTGVSNLTRFSILKLDKNILQLRQVYQNDTIITTYEPTKK